jgi:hypothetical protein
MGENEFPPASKELAARVAGLNAYRAEARSIELMRLAENPFGVAVEKFGQAVAVRYRHESFRNQSRLFNPDLVGEAMWEDVIRFFRSADAPMHVALTPFNFRPGIARKLVEASFHPTSFGVMLYGLAETSLESLPRNMVIREIGKDDSPDAFLDLYLEATGVNHARRELIRRHERSEMRVAGMRCYVAEVNGVAAAVASMLVRDRGALLVAAATGPKYKKAGCLQALLDRRLRDAADAGCDVVFSNTAPGSSAQSNHERAGLRILYTAITWVDSTV